MGGAKKIPHGLLLFYVTVNRGFSLCTRVGVIDFVRPGYVEAFLRVIFKVELYITTLRRPSYAKRSYFAHKGNQ